MSTCIHVLTTFLTVWLYRHCVKYFDIDTLCVIIHFISLHQTIKTSGK